MARRGFYRADKRRKELKRLKKQEEKRKRRLAKLEGGEDAPVEENGEIQDGDIPDDEAVDGTEASDEDKEEPTADASDD